MHVFLRIHIFCARTRLFEILLTMSSHSWRVYIQLWLMPKIFQCISAALSRMLREITHRPRRTSRIPWCADKSVSETRSSAFQCLFSSFYCSFFSSSFSFILTSNKWFIIGIFCLPFFLDVWLDSWSADFSVSYSLCSIFAASKLLQIFVFLLHWSHVST